MKTKVFLPMMAIICAIGMSFATANAGDQTKDYLYLGNGSWMEIDEIDCGSGDEICEAQLGENGPVYEVYDEENLNTRKDTDSEVPFVINPN